MPHPLHEALARLGVTSHSALAIGRRTLPAHGPALRVHTPIDGSRIAEFPLATASDLPALRAEAAAAFRHWRIVPAPVRGEFVRRIGDKLRQHKADLATVVTWEAGKITQESLGEVQEMIDICEFAVGLSRQLHGLTIASERPLHRLMEQWHPLGPVGVISAFNFPVAVWAWNAMLGFVCGDPIIWKPSPKTPLCAISTHSIVQQVMREMPEIPDGLASLIIGDRDVGEALADAPDVPLVSATGSTSMGRAVALRVAARLGRSLLELGGNNAMIVTPSADLEMTIRAIVFSAVGTCGQRCTTLRRLIVHSSRVAEIVVRLKRAYQTLPIGDPMQSGTLIGPLIDEAAFTQMQAALQAARAQGGVVFGGERVPRAGVYVQPAIVEIAASAAIHQHETFAPILYVMTYENFDDAIAIQNAVPQGLSSSIMTNHVREAELFLSPAGSDCGIANVNIGTSGAEIGGAFGGEKETGGGRESGSDSWKAYMRRVTNTINYSTALPLAQGIQFSLEG